MRNINVGIIGTGFIGPAHIEAVHICTPNHLKKLNIQPLEMD